MEDLCMYSKHLLALFSFAPKNVVQPCVGIVCEWNLVEIILP